MNGKRRVCPALLACLGTVLAASHVWAAEHSVRVTVVGTDGAMLPSIVEANGVLPQDKPQAGDATPKILTVDQEKLALNIMTPFGASHVSVLLPENQTDVEVFVLVNHRTTAFARVLPPSKLSALVSWSNSGLVAPPGPAQGESNVAGGADCSGNCGPNVVTTGSSNLVNGLAPNGAAGLFWDTEGVVDDFDLGAATDISCFHVEMFSAVGTLDLGSMRVRIYSAPGGLGGLGSFAGAVPVYDQTMATTITDTGLDAFGFDLLNVDAEGAPANLPAGSYAILVNYPGTFGTHFWATAAQDASDCGGVWGVGADAYSDACIGLGVQDFEAMALSICGPGVEVFGACCDDLTGVCNEGVSNFVCTGRFGGDGVLCADLNPACGAAVGACCFPDETCGEPHTSGSCSAAGGTYQGDGSTCTAGLCEIASPCDGAIGDCCVGNGSIGCDDQDCCECICACDPFCCETDWDGSCGGQGFEPGCGASNPAGLCTAECSECLGGGGLCPPGAVGDCCISNGTAGCDDSDCCELICAQDDFCCNTTWDQLCADAAVAQCTVCQAGGLCPPGATGDCCVNNGTVGCDDPDCCELICGMDDFCCNTTWDQLCADAAVANCAVCAADPTGGCCVQGNCSIETQLDCEGLGGEYLGDGTDCSAQGPATSFDSGAVGSPIPDNDLNGVSHTINVAGSGIASINDIDILLNVSHTFTGDLIVDVEHNGTTVQIVNQPGDATDTPGSPFGCGQDNWADAVVDDEGTGGAFEDQCAADLTSPPNYTPNNPLSAFDGMPMDGDWTITVADSAGFDTGTLNSWSVIHSEPGTPPCTPVGACCRCPGDICEIAEEADCQSPDVYQGDDTACDQAGEVTILEAGGLGLAIPDNDLVGGATHTLNTAESFTIQDVDIDFQIAHTFIGDLIIEVEHGGTTVQVLNQPGDAGNTPGSPFGCGFNDYDAIADDEGTGGALEDLCVGDGQQTSPPNYTPNDALSAFDGLDSAGDWTITVFDSAGFDTGTLNGWSVHIEAPAQGGGICDGACAVCGDGVVEGDEECDDGNTQDGDCCAADCTLEADGSSCGDGATECSGQDTCDGAGNCQANDLGDGTPCGEGPTECSGQDTCDGAGACEANHLPSGTACGSPGDGECVLPDECSGGGVCNPGQVIVDCINDDNCCPAGCNNDTDNDCPLEVPTVSQWGLLILALLLLAGSKAYFGRRQSA